MSVLFNLKFDSADVRLNFSMNSGLQELTLHGNAGLNIPQFIVTLDNLA